MLKWRTLLGFFQTLPFGGSFDWGVLRVGEKTTGELELGEFSTVGPNCWPLLLHTIALFIKKKPWQNGPVEVLLIFPDQNRRKVAERVINQVGAFLGCKDFMLFFLAKDKGLKIDPRLE